MKAYPDAARFWDASRRNKGDIFHTNTVHLLTGALADRMPVFSKGRVLISMLFLDAVFVVDLDTEAVVWGFKSDFKHQHDVQSVEAGTLLLLDNLGGDPGRGGSRILEFGLPDMKRKWSYEGTGTDQFLTQTAGTVQRLANGNTLIAETDNGRALEVTKRGEVVWEFINPHRAGPRNELVASLMMIHRISRSDAQWLQAR